MLGRLWRPGGGLDLEASELAIRTAMHEVGGVLLGKLLNREAAAGAEVKCAAGHLARLVDYRSKEITTVVGQVEFRRAYYHCDECGTGVLPQDEALDLVGTSYSPGVRRLMGRVGGKESFNEGRLDLEELAGIKVQNQSCGKSCGRNWDGDRGPGTEATAARDNRPESCATEIDSQALCQLRRHWGADDQT